MKKWKGRKGKAFFVCATKGVFPFFHLIIFHVRFSSAKQEGKSSSSRFSFFISPPLPLSRALSLSLFSFGAPVMETIGNEDTWMTIALCSNIAKV